MSAIVPVTAMPLLDPGGGRVHLMVAEGMTIAEIVTLALPCLPPQAMSRLRVSLSSPQGDLIVDQAIWERVRPKPGAHVVIRLVPGKDAIRNVLMILVSVAATAIAGFFAPALAGALGFSQGFAKGILTLGLTALGGLLVNALLPQNKPDATDEKPVFAITGWKNTFNPDGPVPDPMGIIRYAPPFGAYSWTEVVGDVLYCRAIFLLGYGPLFIQPDSLKLGDTPFSEYDEIQSEVRYGYPGDAPVSLYGAGPVVETSVGTDLTYPLPRTDAGEIIEGGTPTLKPVSRFTARGVSYGCVVLSFPAGLIDVNEKGDRNWTSVKVRIIWRRVGAMSWYQQVIDIWARKTEGFYRAHFITFPARGDYEIELTNLTPEEPPSSKRNLINRCNWALLQSFRQEYVFNFDKPIAWVALRIKATAQLNGTLDNFNCIVHRIAPDWDSPTQTWVLRGTRNPASLARHVLQGPANAFPVPDDEIDLPAFQEWSEFCWAKGLSYNRVHDFESSLGQTLAAIGAAGRAVVRHDGRKWTVVIDRPRSLVVEHVNPRNSSGFNGSADYFRPPDAIRVPFLDETNDFQQGERVVPWPGHVGPIDVTEQLDLPGKTHPDEIWIETRRRMYEMMHRSIRYSATQQGSARVATSGDLVMASRDVLVRAMHSARVVAVRDRLVEIDDVFTIQPGGSYAIRFRKITPENVIGTSIVRTIAAEPGEVSAFRVTGSGEMPVAGDILHFGPASLESLPLIVTGIERGKDNASVLNMLPAAEIIDTLTDAEVPPPWDGRVGGDTGAEPPAPAAPVFTSILSGTTGTGEVNGLRATLAPGEGSAAIIASYEVRHRENGDGFWLDTATCTAAEATVSIDDYLFGETVDLQARAISTTGQNGPYGPIVTVTIGSADLVPDFDLAAYVPALF